MHTGLFLNAQAPADTDPTRLSESLIDLTRAARDGSFDSITMGQHYVTEYHQLQPIPMLGRLTAEAGTMDVGTGVVLLPLHHPVEIAEQLSTLSLLSDGIIAGFGAGYRDVEFESFGVARGERAVRLEEGIELVRRLWSETDVRHDGDFYSVDGVTINPRPETVPDVWLGASAEPSIERVARIGDAWFVIPSFTFGQIEEHLPRFESAADRFGRDPSTVLFREAFVAPTSDEALDAVREPLTSKYEQYLEWGQDDAAGDDDGGFRELAEECFLIGTPAEVCAQIDRYREAFDPDGIVFRIHWPGLDYDASVDCVELLGDEVLPNC